MAWQPLPDRHTEPKPLSDGLNRLVRSLGLPQTDSLELLFNRWSEVVGPDLASNCRPARLDRGCLTIEAKDHLWATELRWMKSALVERCSAALGAGVVTSVRIGISKG